MPFTAALSQHPDVRQAAGEVIGELLERMGADVDLAALFVTADHADALPEVAGAVRTLLRPGTLIGAAASSVVGGAREIEEGPAVVLWAGRLRGPVHPVRLEAVSGPEGWTFTGLSAIPGSHRDDTRHVVLVADPFSFPADAFVEMVGTGMPAWRVIGGLASAATRPGGNRLVLDGGLYTDGAVGVALSTDSPADIVVSQGCRPVGEPMVVTKAERNVVLELAGKPALERLAQLVKGFDDDERSLARRGLHLGWVIDEHKERFERGDFLIRNVLGGNEELGAIVVGDRIDVGTTVQFQVRDASSADEDLRHLLAGREASGALLFTCTGRGSRLFGRPDHDAELVDGLAAGGTAGMFCAGEIGPVGGRSYLHGFTASVLLLS
jgi:small ligand-binding sensory domain FIST